MQGLKSSWITSWKFLLCSLSTAWFLQACGSDEDSVANSDYDKLWSGLFEGCGSCHGAANADTDGGPDLSVKANFIAALSGKKGSDFPSWDTFNANREDCLNESFLTPGDASSSMIVAVLSSAKASGVKCSVKDHTTTPQLINVSSDVLDDLVKWIDAGAKP